MAAQIRFDNKDEVLHVIERGDELIDYFTSKDVVKRCPLISSKMKTSKLIAEGLQGSVHTVSLGIPGDTKEYVVKKAYNPFIDVYIGHVAQKNVFDLTGEKRVTYKRLVKVLPEKFFAGLDRSVFFALNDVSPDDMFEEGDIFLPEFVEGNKGACKTSRPIEVDKYWVSTERKSNGKLEETRTYLGTFTYPKGSYLCNDEMYTEYVIGLLCAGLFSSGKCANFIDVFGFSTCGGLMPKEEDDEEDYDPNLRKAVFDFTFMEKIHGTVRRNLHKMLVDVEESCGRRGSEDVMDSIILQTLGAISMMQRTLGIQHNDLHNDNVMFQNLNKMEGPVMFDGHDLKEADYFCYDFDGVSVYFKNVGIVIKIADFGYATKYSAPIVGPMILTNRNLDTAAIPGWRDDWYDMILFVTELFMNYNEWSELLCKLMIVMFDPYIRDVDIMSRDDALRISKEVYNNLKGLYTIGGFRSNFTALNTYAWLIMMNYNVVGMHRLKKPPVGSKVVCLGRLRRDDMYSGFNNRGRIMRYDEAEIRKLQKSP